jgi:hypothetical protein
MHSPQSFKIQFQFHPSLSDFLFSVIEFSLISESLSFVSLSLSIITYVDIGLTFDAGQQLVIQTCLGLIGTSRQNITTIQA